MVLGIEKLTAGIIGKRQPLPIGAKVDGAVEITPPTYAKVDGYRTPNYSQYEGPLDHPESRTATRGLNLYTLG